MDRTNESLSHDQDGRHAHMVKSLQTSSPELIDRFPRNWGLLPIIVCSNDDPGLTLAHFTARSNFVT